jgi:hypothetical protein
MTKSEYLNIEETTCHGNPLYIINVNRNHYINTLTMSNMCPFSEEEDGSNNYANLMHFFRCKHRKPNSDQFHKGIDQYYNVKSLRKITIYDVSNFHLELKMSNNITIDIMCIDNIIDFYLKKC